MKFSANSQVMLSIFSMTRAVCLRTHDPVLLAELCALDCEVNVGVSCAKCELYDVQVHAISDFYVSVEFFR